MPTSMRRDKVVYKGTVPVILATLQYAVVFPAPMPGPYDVYFTVSGLSVASTSNQTSAGFTINLSVSLSGTVTWAAVEILS